MLFYMHHSIFGFWIQITWILAVQIKYLGTPSRSSTSKECWFLALSFQFFVGASGENGCISEHTPADGVVVMKIADHAMSYMWDITQIMMYNLDYPSLFFHVLRVDTASWVLMRALPTWCPHRLTSSSRWLAASMSTSPKQDLTLQGEEPSTGWYIDA